MPTPLPFDETEWRTHLARGAPAYVLVNPTEYHGPHLFLLNDHLVSRGLARAVHDRLQTTLGDHPFLLLEDLGIGVEPCPGPGTVFSSYRDVRGRVLDAARRLADLGATRVLLLTFHGSPLHGHALYAGVRALEARGVRAISPLTQAIEQQMRGAIEGVEDAWRPVVDEAARAALMAEVATDFHAGFIETSLALHFAPDTVRGHREVPACPPPRPARVPATLAGLARALGRTTLSAELDLVARGLGWYAMRPFPGYAGQPALANPDSGAVFAHALVDAFVEEARAVFSGERPPRPPPLAWLPAVSLGGRVGAVHVPESQVGLPNG